MAKSPTLTKGPFPVDCPGPPKIDTDLYWQLADIANLKKDLQHGPMIVTIEVTPPDSEKPARQTKRR